MVARPWAVLAGHAPARPAPSGNCRCWTQLFRNCDGVRCTIPCHIIRDTSFGQQNGSSRGQTAKNAACPSTVMPLKLCHVTANLNTSLLHSSNCTGCQSNSVLYKQALITFNVLRHNNPSYLCDLLTIHN